MHDPPARVLVTGATGLIGAYVVRELHASGVGVRALVRDRNAVVPGAERVHGDLDEPGSLAGACRTVQAVLHLAARVAGEPAELERTNVAGTRALVAEARRAGVRRFVLTSSSAVYRDGPLETASEEHPRDGGSAYAGSKIRAEDVVLAAGRAGALETVVLRLPAVYGEGDRHLLPRLAFAARALAVPTTAAGGALRDALHAADLARALRLCLCVPIEAPTVWNLAGFPPARTSDFVRAAADAIGVVPCLFEVPVDLPLDAPGPAWEARIRSLPRPPLPWHEVPAALVERTLDDRRARAALEWSPGIALRPGVLAALRLD